MSRKVILSVFVVLIMVVVPFSSLALVAEEEGSDGGASQVIILPDGARSMDYTKPANFAQLVGWYKALETEYPNYLKIWKANEDYGHGQIPNRSGLDPYDYWIVRLTNESRGFHKPEVFYAGTPHGDETVAPIGQYWFTSWILRHALTDEYNTTEDDWLNWILDNREIYLAINHNPDGFDRQGSWQGRYEANGYDLNRQADYDHVPNSATYNTGPEPFVTPNGRTLRDFIQDHQFGVGSDMHGGIRLLLYPWASSHQSVQATSNRTSITYDYAPPDFDFYDISSLRLGDFIGDFGGDLGGNEIGPVPPTVGYSVPGGIAPWAYGGDVLNNTAEDSHVQDEIYGNYHGAGILWTSPEYSEVKNPPENQFGSDTTPGWGPEVRRFILHQTDLAEPYIWITKDSVANDTVVNIGDDIQFLWKVNGCLVVDDTFIQYGTDPDPIHNFDNTTPHRNMFKDRYWGGTGWENADGGTHVGYVHGQVIKAPDQVGDHYFVIRAMVDQVYGNVTAPGVYGDESYLRIVKQRTDPSFSETIEGADGSETMTGQLWWYSDIIHIKVVKKPEIINFTPEDDSVWVPTDTNISLEFDLEMDHDLTEDAFGISPSVPGAFMWNGTNMTFDPDTELTSETRYTISLDTSATSYLDTTLEHPFYFNFTTAYSSDITPPSIIGHQPYDDEVDVPIDIVIRIDFSEDMDMVSTEQAFSMVPVTSGEFSWANGTSELSFRPDVFLDGPTDHIVSIGPSAMDLGRNHLPELYSFNFRTEVPDKVIPFIVSTEPNDGDVMVRLDSNISIVFSEAMHVALTEDGFNITPWVEGNLTWSDDTTLVFDPLEDLTPETVYTVTMNDTAADLYLNTIAEPKVVSFTSVDITPPRVVDTIPVDRDVNVSVETDIIMNFSEDMDEASLGGAFIIDPDVMVVLNLEGATATFAPSTPLKYETLYNVTLTTGATDMNGLSIPEDHLFSFTTIEPPDLQPPFVTTTTPEQGETNVSVWTSISITFNEEVVLPTTGAIVTLSPDPVYGHDTVLEGDTLRLLLPLGMADPWLADLTEYTVTVTGGMADLAGNRMGSEHSFTFETGYHKGPNITDVDPDEATTVDVDTSITITFNREMNWTTVEGAFSIGPDVEGTFTHTDDTITFTPSKKLKNGKTYTVTVATGARDHLSNGLVTPLNYDFHTEKAPGPTNTGLFSGYNLMFLLLIIIIIVAAVIIGARSASRKKGGSTGPPPQMMEEPSPGAPEAVEPVPEPPPTEQPPPEPPVQPEPAPTPEPVLEPEQPPQVEQGPRPEPEAPEGSIDDIIRQLEE